jgi:hypothetical protein
MGSVSLAIAVSGAVAGDVSVLASEESLSAEHECSADRNARQTGEPDCSCGFHQDLFRSVGIVRRSPPVAPEGDDLEVGQWATDMPSPAHGRERMTDFPTAPADGVRAPAKVTQAQ